VVKPAVLVVLMFALTAGCSLSPEKKGYIESHAPEMRLSRGQLRVWVHDSVLDCADRIEEAADQIQARAREPELRRNALLWKINAIQAAFRAASRRDPLGSFVDLWIFCVQMAEFFDDSGPGRYAFGVHQALALATAQAMESRMEASFSAAMKPEAVERRLREMRDLVDRYAKTYPVQNLYFRREPLSGHSSTAALPEIEELGAAFADIEQDLVTMQRILAAHLEYLPTIARWEAELLLLDEERTGILADSLSLLKEMEALLREVLTKQIPEFVSGQTTQVLSAVTKERTAALDGIDEMRIGTLDAVEHERKALTAEIDRQRMATLDVIQEERKAVLREIHDIARESTGSVLSSGQGLIDHLVGRIALTGAALVVIVLIGGVLVVAILHLRKARPAP